jgi:molybdenum cofactor biosynthesis protein B
VRIAVLTVSDTRSLAEDRSGDILVARLTEAGHVLADRAIVPDERVEIAARLRHWIEDPGVDVVISTGGTGLTGRDVTVEAHEDVYEKAIPAFGTLFTMISYGKIGTSAIQSRACAGVAGGTYLFALPGSPGACRDGWDEILAAPGDRRPNRGRSDGSTVADDRGRCVGRRRVRVAVGGRTRARGRIRRSAGRRCHQARPARASRPSSPPP